MLGIQRQICADVEDIYLSLSAFCIVYAFMSQSICLIYYYPVLKKRKKKMEARVLGGDFRVLGEEVQDATMEDIGGRRDRREIRRMSQARG